MAKQYIIVDTNQYPLSAPIGYEKYPSMPIAGNNRSPIGIGSYRLPIDLEPIVQGRVFIGPRVFNGISSCNLFCFVDRFCGVDMGQSAGRGVGEIGLDGGTVERRTREEFSWKDPGVAAAAVQGDAASGLFDDSRGSL